MPLSFQIGALEPPPDTTSVNRIKTSVYIALTFSGRLAANESRNIVHENKFATWGGCAKQLLVWSRSEIDLGQAQRRHLVVLLTYC